MKIKILVLIGILFTAVTVFASPAEEADKALSGLSSRIEEFDFYSYARELTEGKTPGIIPRNLTDIIFGEVRTVIKVLGGAFAPILLFGILRFVGVGKEGVSEGAFILCFALVMTAVTGVFKGMSELVYDTAATIELINKSLVPVLFTLLASTGSLTQATVSQPVVIGASQIISYLLFNFILPGITLSYALVLTDCITGMGGMKYMGEMLLKISKKLLIFFVVVFMGILSVQKLMGNAVDSVVLRGTRFAVSNFIPVVGGAISEGIEALGASMQVIRNSTGIAGIAGVTAVTVPPLIKIYSVSLVFHFFAAVSLPVSDKRFGEMLSFSGEVMSIFGSVILCMAFIFIVTAGVVVGSRVI